MKTAATFSLAMFVLLSSCSGQYTPWEKDKVDGGMEFSRVKYMVKGNDTTMTVGFLKKSAMVDGLNVSADWLHLNGKKEPVLCRLEEDHELNNMTVPKGTWVLEKRDRLVVVFPEDTLIQGYLCRGGGGSGGIRTSFYPSGSLQFFYTKGVTEVQGVKCKGGTIHQISLFEDGSLRECTLEEEHLFNSVLYKKGLKITFDKEGKVIKAERFKL